MNRTHKKDEDFREYFFDVFDLCDKVDPDMGDKQKTYYILRGMGANVRDQLKLQRASNPKELFELAEKIFPPLGKQTRSPVNYADGFLAEKQCQNTDKKERQSQAENDLEKRLANIEKMLSKNETQSVNYSINREFRDRGMPNRGGYQNQFGGNRNGKGQGQCFRCGRFGHHRINCRTPEHLLGNRNFNKGNTYDGSRNNEGNYRGGYGNNNLGSNYNVGFNGNGRDDRSGQARPN